MAPSLKDPETDRLARELARRTGESLTVAVRHALRDKLVEPRALELDTIEAKIADVMQIVARHQTPPLLDHRSDDEILGWDDNGLPS